MDKGKIVKGFYKAIAREMTVTLATAADGAVTMRAMSPVLHEGKVLMFTDAASCKYAQLRANPRCCIGSGRFFATARAEFCGDTMAAENAPLRAAYEKKFPGAFVAGDEFGGCGREFILLKLETLTGWGFAEGAETNGIPTEPFEIELDKAHVS